MSRKLDLRNKEVRLTLASGREIVLSTAELLLTQDRKTDGKAFERELDKKLQGEETLDRDYYMQKALDGGVHVISKRKGLPPPTEDEWGSITPDVRVIDPRR